MRPVGVIGGLGPLAGADVLRKIAEEDGRTVVKEQDRVPIILLSDPRVPERTAALLHGGPDFMPALRDQITLLERIGVSAIAIACNTAHARWEELQGSTTTTLISLIEVVVRAIEPSDDQVVGVLGTEATIHLGLFTGRLRTNRVQVVLPSALAMELTTTAILRAKQGDVPSARVALTSACAMLRQDGATHILLGCTELPVILEEELRIAPGGYIDPNRLLAREIVRVGRLDP